MTVAVKICGLNSESSVQAVVGAGADFAGFVHFDTSPRHVSLARAAELKKLLPHTIRSVMVVVNPDALLLADIIRIVQPDLLQLHGEETPHFLYNIRRAYPTVGIIKAIPISKAQDLLISDAYRTFADYFLFDAKPPKDTGLPGGNALSFDWSLLTGKSFARPWFLSGGLHPENVAAAIQKTGAEMVDVSSGVESAPGVKDATLIDAFVRATK